mmetsp:Transcript_3028/g.3199  ORF Transcript_3028/g.3199 Transcript_3028/m.3199 type:complete len:197 (-) Transcript_3028:211-801(-)
MFGLLFKRKRVSHEIIEDDDVPVEKQLERALSKFFEAKSAFEESQKVVLLDKDFADNAETVAVTAAAKRVDEKISIANTIHHPNATMEAIDASYSNLSSSMNNILESRALSGKLWCSIAKKMRASAEAAEVCARSMECVCELETNLYLKEDREMKCSTSELKNALNNLYENFVNSSASSFEDQAFQKPPTTTEYTG